MLIEYHYYILSQHKRFFIIVFKILILKTILFYVIYLKFQVYLSLFQKISLLCKQFTLNISLNAVLNALLYSCQNIITKDFAHIAVITIRRIDLNFAKRMTADGYTNTFMITYTTNLAKMQQNNLQLIATTTGQL